LLQFFAETALLKGSGAGNPKPLSFFLHWES